MSSCTLPENRSESNTFAGAHNGLTVVTLVQGSARKTWTLAAQGWSSTAYQNNARLKSAREIERRDLAALGELLTWLEGEPLRHVVLGRLKIGVEFPIQRGHLGEPAPFYAAPIPYLPLDLDSLPLEPDYSAPERTARRALELLKLPLDLGMIWQWSASASRKPGLRARAWLELERPTPLDALKTWAKWRWCKARGAGVQLDSALYTASQPIYTARPEYIGAPDPLPTRTFYFEGAQLPAREVQDWLELAESAARRQRALAQKRREHKPTTPLPHPHTAAPGVGRGWLSRRADDLAATPKGARHEATRDAVWWARQRIQEGQIDAAEAREALEWAVSGFENPAHHIGIIRRDLGGL